MSAVRVLAGRVTYGALALALVLWAPVEPPSPQVGLAVGLLAGATVGCATFAALARRLPPVGRPPVARALVVACPVVVVAAASEEAVWRLAVFGGLRSQLGPAVALVATSVAFAAAHAGRSPPQTMWVHLLTGCVFCSVYLASGRLAAAVMCHVVYNLLVVAACAAWTAPLQPTGAT